MFPFARVIVVRGVLLWILGRLTLAFFLHRLGAAPFDLTFRTMVVLCTIVLLLLYREMRRNNEVVLLANLGVRPGIMVLAAMIPILLLEAALGLALP